MTELEIRKISENLKAIPKNSAIDYVKIFKCTTEILEMTDENQSMPVDVYKIVEKLSILALKQPLYRNSNNLMVAARTSNKTSIVMKKFQHAILVNEATCHETRRFALAYEIAISLLHLNEGDKFYECQFELPCMYATNEEVVASVFARFLLVPYEKAKYEFSLWKKDDTMKWYEYIGRLAEIPYEEAVIAWEQIRIIEMLL